MAQIFCPTCGSKNDYANGRRPNFCFSCGYNFASLAAFGGAADTPVRKPNSGAMDIDVDTDTSSGRGTSEGFTPDDVEIVGRANAKVVQGAKGNATVVVDANRQNFGDFVRWQIPPEEARHALNTKAKRANAKETLTTFAKEAGKGGAQMKDAVSGGDATVGETA